MFSDFQNKTAILRRSNIQSTQENTIGHTTSGVNRLSSVLSRSPMLIKHRPSHLNQRPILPLYNPILLWSVGGRILVFKTLITAEGVKMSIFEFCAIITVNRSHGLGSSFFNLKIKSRINLKASSLVLMKKTQE